MATVFKTDKGWAYRIKIKDPYGKTVDTTGRIDSDGQPFKTKTAAQKAREKKIAEIKSRGVETHKKITLNDLYEQYKDDPIAKTKAFNTLLKQDSMWRNHVKDRFGDMFVDEITVGHIENYLSDLYFVKELSFAYVEGHLKFFYMLMGYAYKYGYIDDTQYNRMLINKSSRIKMPNKKIKDNKDIEIYTEQELDKIYEVVKGTNHEIAFQIGRFCGLRIAEVYAITWNDIDMREGSLTVNKQLIYMDGIWHFAQPKSKNAIRKIEMPEKLQTFLIQKSIEQEENKKKLGLSYRNHERIIDDRTGEVIIGADLINRKENGEFMTPNTVKYYRRIILEKTGIEYRYHNLRHTHLSQLAWQGVPSILLKQRAGHGKIDTTLRYYIGTTYYADDMVEALEKL